MDGLYANQAIQDCPCLHQHNILEADLVDLVDALTGAIRSRTNLFVGFFFTENSKNSKTFNKFFDSLFNVG